MEKSKNASAWTEVGYTLFADEGPGGLMVERLARILQLNKSGFYHYFGDMDVYRSELLRLHQQKAALYFADIASITTIEPAYFQTVVKHKVSVMFQMQLLRQANNAAFYRVAQSIDEREDMLIRDLWSDYLGFADTPDLAVRYFAIVRDMFYSRASIQNLTYEFILGLMTEARELMQQIAAGNVMAHSRY